MSTILQIDKTKIDGANKNLVKIASLLKDTMSKEKQAMLGPQETADMITEIVGSLTSLADELSGMGGAPAGAPPDGGPPSDKVPPKGAELEDEENKTKMAAMEEKLSVATTWIDRKERERIAAEYASLFGDPKAKEKAAKDILESKEDLKTLEVRVKEAKTQRDAFIGDRSRHASTGGFAIHRERQASMDSGMYGISLRGK